MEDLLHLPVQQARLVCENRGYRLRVVRRDGETLLGTADYDDRRINVWSEDGKVVKIDCIG